MSITFHSDGSIAHLTNGTISYVIELLDHACCPTHIGQAIRAWHGTRVTIPRPTRLCHRVCRRHAKPVLRRPAL